MDFVAADFIGGVQVKGKGPGGSDGSGSATRGGGGGSSSLAAADESIDIFAKRRKLDVSTRTDRESGDASTDSPCVVHCERCEVAEAEVDSPAAAVMDERCSSVDAEDPGSTSCCCSSDESTEKTIESVDLEVKGREVDATTIQARFKSERKTNNKAEDGGRSDAPERNPCRRQTPTQAEIDNFFSAAETNTVLLFKEKYNFDFEKGEPLKGRYEWKPLILPAVKKEEDKLAQA